jgi:hypothetical protein
MIKLVLKQSIEEYKNNLKVMLSFGILFVFSFLFLFLNQFFLSSGTIFIAYTESLVSILGLVLALIFLFFFSFFISLTVYSIKRDVQQMSFDDYWNQLMRNAAVKVFVYYFFLAILSYIILLVGLYTAMSIIAVVIVLIISALTMYVPQSIVLDEVEFKRAVKESLIFWKNNFILSVLIIFVGSFFLFLITLIEFALELFMLPGIIVSFLLVLIFLVPFIEQMKSYAFILKFNLIKQSETLSAELKPKPKKKIDAVRLRQNVKGGKI